MTREVKLSNGKIAIIRSLGWDDIETYYKETGKDLAFSILGPTASWALFAIPRALSYKDGGTVDPREFNLKDFSDLTVAILKESGMVPESVAKEIEESLKEADIVPSKGEPKGGKRSFRKSTE